MKADHDKVCAIADDIQLARENLVKHYYDLQKLWESEQFEGHEYYLINTLFRTILVNLEALDYIFYWSVPEHDQPE